VNGHLGTMGSGGHLSLDDCHISGSFLGSPCIKLMGDGSTLLRRCTVQVGFRCM
jgi:hypothetical protein